MGIKHSRKAISPERPPSAGGATAPYWHVTANVRPFPRLRRDLQTDVVVIGGGLTGITAAYLLRRAGRRVVLLERGRLATTDTGHTTAHLTCALDTPITELVARFGEDHARAAWDAGLAALAQIDACVRDERIDCDFAWVPGYLHAAPRTMASADEVSHLRREAETAAALGFDATFIDRLPLMEQPGVLIRDQARFHPRRYLAALVAAITADEGGAVFEHTAAEEVQSTPLAVRAGAHQVRCDYVVIATHNPLVGKAGLVGATFLQTKLFLYSSYAVGARMPPGQIPDALFWDTADPYHYLRLERRPGFDYLLYGGEDHKTGQADDGAARFERLAAGLAALAPGAQTSVVGPGHRDRRRAAVHRGNRPSAVCRDRVLGQWADVRHSGGDDGLRRRHGPREPLGRPVRSRPHERPRRPLELPP
jgi:glycine/D-amino acid oxidase-like deaminating enzyme